MQKQTLSLLECPNTRKNNLRVFAHQLKRNDVIIENVDDSNILDGDEIVTGVIVNPEINAAYPIYDSVATLLSDADTDVRHHVVLLESVRQNCPNLYATAIDETISRLSTRKDSDHGQWNREEMVYYDRLVKSEDLRQAFLNKIKKEPLWALYLPRQRHLIKHISPYCNGNYVLEVGCGNARTVSWALPPKIHSYNYVGVDISWHRLVLAKSVIPEGDFIQASAFNLPFKNSVFRAIIGFGVFHHLPSPSTALINCIQKLEPDGLLVLHEPIKTPKLLREGSALKKLVERAFSEYEHSKHDGEIELSETLGILTSHKCEVIKLNYSNSVILPLVMKCLPGSTSNKFVVQFSMLLDQFMLKTFCKISPRLGPRGVYLLARKLAA